MLISHKENGTAYFRLGAIRRYFKNFKRREKQLKLSKEEQAAASSQSRRHR